MSAGLAATAPTGSYKNGASDGRLSPTVYVGKGHRMFDIQTAASESLRIGRTHTLGRPVGWSTVLQAKIAKKLWPEVEVNSMFFRGGPNDGRVQAFATPGLMISKIKLRPEAKDRLAIVFGAGEQIAFTQYHAYNHGLSFTLRIVF